MSLSCVFPEVDFVWSAVNDQVKPIEAPAYPRTVEFRKGGPIRELESWLERDKMVVLNAAPGAGKSLVVPRMLASNYPLVHILPSAGLAATIAAMPSRASETCEVLFAETFDDSYVQLGRVVVTSAAAYISWLIGPVGGPMPGVVLYVDEVHSSDAYAYVVRQITQVMRDSALVVHASASLAGGRRLPAEGIGRVEDVACPELVDQIPKPSDTDKPWSYENLSKGLAFYTDSVLQVRELHENYSASGAAVFVLCGRTRPKEVVDTLARCRVLSAGEKPYVLILDSTFRVGYSLPVGVIVDFSRILTRAEDEDGAPVSEYRRIGWADFIQTRHRVARVPGQSGVYCTTGEQPDKRTIRVEGVDVDVAAVLFRALAYDTPAEIAHSSFCNGPVPKNLIASLNGSLYFRHLPLAELMDMRVRGAGVNKVADKSWVDDLFAADLSEQTLNPDEMYDYSSYDNTSVTAILPRGIVDVPEYLKLVVRQDFEKLAMLDATSLGLVASHTCKSRVAAQTHLGIIRDTVERNRSIVTVPMNRKFIELMRAEYGRATAEVQYYFKLLLYLTQLGFRFSHISTADVAGIRRKWEDYYQPLSDRYRAPEVTSRGNLLADYSPPKITNHLTTGSVTSTSTATISSEEQNVIARPRGRWKRQSSTTFKVIYD